MAAEDPYAAYFHTHISLTQLTHSSTSCRYVVGGGSDDDDDDDDEDDIETVTRNLGRMMEAANDAGFQSGDPGLTVTGSAIPGAGAVYVPQGVVLEEWTCPECTLHNDAGTQHCTVCDAPHPTLTHLAASTGVGGGGVGGGGGGGDEGGMVANVADLASVGLRELAMMFDQTVQQYLDTMATTYCLTIHASGETMVSPQTFSLLEVAMLPHPDSGATAPEAMVMALLNEEPATAAAQLSATGVDVAPAGANPVSIAGTCPLAVACLFGFSGVAHNLVALGVNVKEADTTGRQYVVEAARVRWCGVCCVWCCAVPVISLCSFV